MATNHFKKIKINGELKIRKLTSIQSKLLRYSDTNIGFDLSDIIEFDTAALQLLLSLNKELQSKGCELRIMSASEAVKKLIRFYHKEFLLLSTDEVNPEGKKIGSA